MKKKQSLIDMFDQYDLSESGSEDDDVSEDYNDDKAGLGDDEPEEEARHLHRLAKTMHIKLSRDEKSLEPFDLIKHRVEQFADFLKTTQDQSDRIVSDPWDDYPNIWDTRRILNRLEGQVGDSIHLILRMQPDKLEDVIGYLNDCSHEPGALSSAAKRLMAPGARGESRGLAFHILNREKIKRSPASGAIVFDDDSDVSEAFVRSRVRASIIDKLNK